MDQFIGECREAATAAEEVAREKAAAAEAAVAEVNASEKQQLGLFTRMLSFANKICATSPTAAAPAAAASSAAAAKAASNAQYKALMDQFIVECSEAATAAEDVAREKAAKAEAAAAEALAAEANVSAKQQPGLYTRMLSFASKRRAPSTPTATDPALAAPAVAEHMLETADPENTITEPAEAYVLSAAGATAPAAGVDQANPL